MRPPVHISVFRALIIVVVVVVATACGWWTVASWNELVRLVSDVGPWLRHLVWLGT